MGANQESVKDDVVSMCADVLCAESRLLQSNMKSVAEQASFLSDKWEELAEVESSMLSSSDAFLYPNACAHIMSKVSELLMNGDMAEALDNIFEWSINVLTDNLGDVYDDDVSYSVNDLVRDGRIVFRRFERLEKLVSFGGQSFYDNSGSDYSEARRKAYQSVNDDGSELVQLLRSVEYSFGVDATRLSEKVKSFHAQAVPAIHKIKEYYDAGQLNW